MKKTPVRPILAATFLVLLGCVHSASSQIAWEKADFVGYSFSLISDTDVRTLWFQDDGVVVAQVGTPGFVAAPIYHWTLNERGSLRIYDGKNRTVYRPTIVRVDGDVFTVNDRGREERLERRPLHKKTAQPGATDNPDDAQRLREDH